MGQKWAFVVSLICHAVIFVVLATGIDFSRFNVKKQAMPIAARLVVKKQKNKDHLPRKAKAVPDDQRKEKEQPKEKDKLKKEEPKSKQLPKEKLEKVAEVKKASKAASMNAPDYTKALASLSKSFAQELATDTVTEEPEGEVVADSSYFDQVYSLIKESFVVPPHINGPQGRSLRTVLKIYLASDGSLLDIVMVTPSGDDHFDKAVMDGTRRVDNFGVVPVILQSMVRNRGIEVELCPFTCPER